MTRSVGRPSIAVRSVEVSMSRLFLGSVFLVAALGGSASAGVHHDDMVELPKVMALEGQA